MHAFVLDRNRKPLTPCPGWHGQNSSQVGPGGSLPTVPLHDHLQGPGGRPGRPRASDKDRSGLKTTGIAIVQEGTGQVVAAVEVEHRGQLIKASLESRAAPTTRPEGPQERYRKPRFDNRTRPEGWLPPSLESRVANVLTWVGRLLRLCPITAASQELVRFDLQKEQDPEISGIAYQQGTLAGYETREYLLEKWHRTCLLRQERRATPVEHIHPKSQGGLDRVSNLCPGVRAMQSTQGQHSRRSLPEGQAGGPVADPETSQGPAQGRRRGQCHPMGVVPPTRSHRPAGGMRLGRTDEVQPHDTRPAQDPLARRRVRRGRHA